MSIRPLLFLLMFVLMFPALAHPAPSWRWEDDFSAEEKIGLRAWISTTERGLARLAVAPPDFRVHFARRAGRGEPVPWAETDKGHGPQVFFYVDTAFPWDNFLDDWTAPHELSHLLFPYLGRDSRWFAEGIASYLQYQVMYASGTLSWAQSVERVSASFRRAAGLHRGSGISIVSLSQRPRGRKAQVRYYWGGAAYFLHVDMRLQKDKGLRLNQVIRRYVDCCYRPWGTDAAGMMRKLDALSESSVFTEVYAQLMDRSDFPPLDKALAWLRQNPPALADTPAPPPG